VPCTWCPLVQGNKLWYLAQSRGGNSHFLYGKDRYHFEISYWFPAFEDIDDGVDISRACETARENVKVSTRERQGCCELKRHKPWFDEGRSKLLDQMKHVKLQLLWQPSKINEDDLNNVRCEGRRNFWNRQREYIWKTKLMSVEQTVRRRISETCIDFKNALPT
jgi:hypothetical protein